MAVSLAAALFKIEALIPGAAVGDAGEPIGAALAQQGSIEPA